MSVTPDELIAADAASSLAKLWVANARLRVQTAALIAENAALRQTLADAKPSPVAGTFSSTSTTVQP